MKDFELLSRKENLGFYRSAEITNAFIIDNKEKDIYNFFTICVMEDREPISTNKKVLSTKPIKINNRFSFGCYQFQKDIKSSELDFEKILSNKHTGIIDIGEGSLKVGLLKLIPKQFVPQNSSKDVSLNRVLKNNFKNGSYLLEFFDVSKPLNKLLNEKEIKKHVKYCLK